MADWASKYILKKKFNEQCEKFQCLLKTLHRKLSLLFKESNKRPAERERVIALIRGGKW